jgi:hypothetical protein
MTVSPQAAAEKTARDAALPQRPGEHFVGFGVMGLPFDSGHYLALRRFPANTIGGAYHSVWHRDPCGEWVFYGDTPPMHSCARYFDAALARTEMARIRLYWPAPDRLAITVDGALDWTVRLQRTPATAALTGLGRLLPEPMWRSPAAIAVVARCAGAALRAGRMGLAGRLPNGQAFLANPRQLWAVTASSARLHGVDLGSPAPLCEQARLGDFWLPQRGLFAVGQVWAESFDAHRHHVARSASVPAASAP